MEKEPVKNRQQQESNAFNARQGIDSGNRKTHTEDVARVITTEAVHFAVVPNDCKIESLAALQFPDGRRPERIKASVMLLDAASFAGYVNTYKDHRTRTFANPANFNFLSVIDYHGEGADSLPEFCQHRATFPMKPDDRWNIWTSFDGKPFSQVDFAEFVEDNRADIYDPEPARMLEIASDLTAHTEVNFGSSTRLGNGQTRIRYEETIKSGVPSAGDIEVPEEFKIRIPVFYGESATTISVRLRFRLNQGKLSFTYKLYSVLEGDSG